MSADVNFFGGVVLVSAVVAALGYYEWGLIPAVVATTLVLIVLIMTRGVHGPDGSGG